MELSEQIIDCEETCKYHSLDDFFFDRYAEEYEVEIRNRSEKQSARNYARTQARRLERTAGSIGVEIKAFWKEDTNRYQITSAVADLFKYMVYYFQETYYDEIKKLEFHHIPERVLIELRYRLRDAFYSIGYSLEQVENNLKKYEAVTGCPPVGEYAPVSQLVLEGVQFWREEYEKDLTPQQWANFTQEIEFYYRTEWIGKFKDAVKNRLVKYCGGEKIALSEKDEYRI